jgi:hypothetical protein
MPRPHRLAGLAAAALLLGAAPAVAKGPPKPLEEWPCGTPFAGPLAAEMLWPGADAQPAAEGAWEADPVARRLVEFLTAGENSPAMGQREIEDFTARNGALNPETSRRVVAGMAERGNKLRVILLEGIKKQIIKSHVLAAAIDENTTQLGAVKASADGRDAAAALAEARRQNLSGLDDADDTAAQLCHRLVYDETKLKTLAAAVMAHTR